ncbi:ABC transporter permease [Paenibacillaceae bacterium WGS1546]|uniref:ABC transporter permease n=1 Tax=Cohnella sp. WGS1546 TaxID=3366810 RepID=UPI00372D5551
MLSFFIKDFLVYWRDRKEISISLITPLVLIAVLGFAMPSLFANPANIIEVKAAVVQLDDEEAGLRQFREALAARSLPEEQSRAIEAQLETVMPIRMLMQLFEEEQVKEIVRMERMEAEEALGQLRDGLVDAVLTIPEGYTLATLNRAMLGEGAGAELRIAAEDWTMSLDVLNNIVNGFVRTTNFQSAIQSQLGAEAAAAANEVGDFGGRETVPGVETVTSFQYFTLAIGIVFALFVAVTTATKAVTEKRERTFQRILLTGAHPLKYLSGKLSSTFCLALILLSFVLVGAHFMFGVFSGRSFAFWAGMSAVLLVLMLCVGAMAALFTALVFRLDDSMANGITFLFILVAGTIGGSFAPVFILPDWLRLAGEWTPNGLALSALLKWLQTETAADLTVSLIRLAVFAAVTIGLAIWCFPRRGRI